MKRVLVNVPGLELPGGVANYYRSLQLDREPSIEYFFIIDEIAHNWLARLWRIGSKYWRFFVRLRHFDAVLINPSLNRNSFWRDAIFALLIRLSRKELIVFWRGWSWEYFDLVKRRPLERTLYRISFAAAAKTLYLTSQFEKAIADAFGARRDGTYLVTTVADDSQIVADPEPGPPYDNPGPHKAILFLSRMEREKGIFIVLDVYAHLRQERDDVELIMAGSGPDLQEARDYVERHRIPNVSFPGFITDAEKHATYKRADIFLFPTQYGEGMPNSILEAMRYGVPVVSRYNAGIPDVITHGKHGFLTNGTSATDFYPFLRRLLDDNELRHQMSLACVQAATNFTPEAVRKKLLSLLGV